MRPRPHDADLAREQARRGNGQFGHLHRDEADVDLLSAEDKAPRTRQTAAPLLDRSLAVESRLAREVARLVEDGSMIVDPPYQRGAVWSEDQKVALVKSWLEGVPVPAIIVNDRGTGAWRQANGTSPMDTDEPIYAVVDGRQRCETAVDWFRGDLAVPASWFSPDDVVETVETDDGPYVTHLGLSRRGQTVMAFKAKLPMASAQLATVEEEASMYLLTNGGGTAQTEADMANAARIAGVNR